MHIKIECKVCHGDCSGRTYDFTAPAEQLSVKVDHSSVDNYNSPRNCSYIYFKGELVCLN